MKNMPTIICYSEIFVPLCNAEAFCTTRFLSALAAEGCKVYVVTHEYLQELPEDVVAELQHPDITVIRVPPVKRPVPLWKRFLKRKEYGINWLLNTSKAAQSELKKLLIQHPDAVLLSRCMPIHSHLTVLPLRKHAKFWVAHFSDPFPMLLRNISVTERLANMIRRWYVKRILKSADMVTVTCPRAIRFFLKEYGERFARKFMVATHIGTPGLAPDESLQSAASECKVNDPDCFWVFHTGYLYEIVQPLLDIADELDKMRVIQYGKSTGIPDALRSLSWCRIAPDGESTPRASTTFFEMADVNIIVEPHFPYPFSPLIRSSMAYVLQSDTPVFVIAVRDSDTHDLAKKFPELYYADIDSPNEIVETMLKIKADSDVGVINTPSLELRTLFSAEHVAREFLVEIGKRAGITS